MSTSLRASAITAALMLGTFALLMIPGFWLRHGYPIWSAF